MEAVMPPMCRPSSGEEMAWVYKYTQITPSLEPWLNRVGAPVIFLDLRGARERIHWLLQPLLGALSAQLAKARSPIVWPAVFDGVLFFIRMTPATLLR